MVTFDVACKGQKIFTGGREPLKFSIILGFSGKYFLDFPPSLKQQTFSGSPRMVNNLEWLLSLSWLEFDNHSFYKNAKNLTLTNAVIINFWRLFTLPGLTAMAKHDDHAMTWYDHGDSYSPWYDHGDSYSPWYDHGKMMAWQLCFSNPGSQKARTTEQGGLGPNL